MKPISNVAGWRAWRCSGVAGRCLLAAWMAGLAGGRAQAQLVDRYYPDALPGYESDLRLPLQPYDPRLARGRGVEVGDFNVEPSLTESAGYNSNPLGNGSRGSSLLDTDASVSLGSDWRRDALDANLSVDNTNYFDQPLASQTDWTASLGGALDVGRGRIDAAYSHLVENLGPTSLGVLGITAPVPYQTDDFRLDDNAMLGRFRLIPAFEFENFNFGQASGPVAVDYSVLNHHVVSGTGTALYELSTGRSVVAIVRGASASYGNGVPTASEAGYDDILGLTGIDFQANAPIRIRALVGGETRSFNLSPSQEITTPAAELDVIWEPTRLTRVTTTIDRQLVDATSPFSGSQLTTEGRLEVQHALRRNVELSAYVDVGSSQFWTNQVASFGNDQLETSAGLSANWTLNRHVSMLLSYDYSHNDYSGLPLASGSFSQPSSTFHVISLGLTFSE